jgi:protein SCO1/2
MIQSKLFMLLLIALLAAACTIPSRDAASVGQPSCCASNAEPSATFTDKSLYQLDSTWTNDARQPLKLGKLRGRVQVVAMFFASCTYACPVIVTDMRRIETALSESVRSDVGFTLVTIDTERDTPKALYSYRVAHKLPADRWTLLHGTPDDTLELAALLGVKFKREATGQFAHSNLITVLNSEGEIIHQLVGLNQDLQETVRRIERAVEHLRPPAHQVH